MHAQVQIRRTAGTEREGACLHVEGDDAGLEAACDRLLADWLPASGYALRDAPIMPLYLDDPEQVEVQALRAGVCVPVHAA